MRMKSGAYKVLKFSVHTRGLASLPERLVSASEKAEHTVAIQVQKDTSPYVPFLTGSLDTRTRVDGSYIIYPGPYARYLYYGKVMVDAATGKGPMRIVSKDGTEVIRFRKGATLKPIDRDLKIQRSMHPKAQSFWFEASKAKNLPKWLRVAKEATMDEFKQ